MELNELERYGKYLAGIMVFYCKVLLSIFEGTK
jgi:hypothetical protein